jgi:hypothetical protein
MSILESSTKITTMDVTITEVGHEIGEDEGVENDEYYVEEPFDYIFEPDHLNQAESASSTKSHVSNDNDSTTRKEEVSLKNKKT